SFLNGCLSIGVMSALALLTHSPFIFPSLGPTAFLFFYTPLAPSAAPRNTIFGHGIGVLAGYVSLLLTGLTAAGSALTVGVTWPRVIATALSLGLTSGLMVLLRAPHPPAGATTLIIALGLLTKPNQLVLLMVAVVLLTVQAFIINRLAGIPYPLWSNTPNGDDPVEREVQQLTKQSLDT
ncbi:MAG: HPP family protein, partial [Ktedonobacterales bacterium]